MTDYNSTVIANSKQEIKDLTESLVLELFNSKKSSAIIEQIASLEKQINKRGGGVIINPLIEKVIETLNKEKANILLLTYTMDELMDLKRDYVNNFITVSKFAEFHNLNEGIAQYILDVIEV